jgi:hypothetical protein
MHLHLQRKNNASGLYQHAPGRPRKISGFAVERWGKLVGGEEQGSEE